MAEEEYPSAPKREIDLGKGVVILPPERIVSPKKPEKPKEERKEEQKMEQKISNSVQPKEMQINSVLFVIVSIVALVSLVLSIITMMSIASLKSELRAISSDLKEFSRSTIELNTQFDQPHSLQSSVPLNQVLSPFSIPIPSQEIETKGTINVVLPVYGLPVSIPWEGKLTVFGSITTNTSAIPQSETLKINYTLPSSGTVRMKISASELFQGKLNSIIERLDNLSK
ncbi:MAG: hypothetical protein QXO35_03420 [Candidatus Micrarchaeia archaeon]